MKKTCMRASKRFERLARKYGFRLKKVSNMWFKPDGKFVTQIKRTDILSVQYRNHHIMTIPKVIYPFVKQGYKPLGGRQAHPDYFTLEHQLKNWNLLVKRTPHIRQLEQETKPL